MKFAPQANWGNDFGFVDAISQESKDLAGLSDEGGNLKVGIAGWYLVYVSVIGDDKVIEFEKPNVYLMGDTSYNGWDAQLVEQDLFTVPGTADGDQAAVQGKTGQKVYLNFGNGTGRIE